MLRWEWVAIGYFTYLALVALLRPFPRPRLPVLFCAAVAWLVLPQLAWQRDARPDVAHALVPVFVLLTGYWVSGFFFVRPMARVERLLQWIDDVCGRAIGADRWPAMATRWAARYLELAYLLVYVMVPAGAIALVVAGRDDAIDAFWTTVLFAAFASYGMLPWVQTRPPRSACPPKIGTEQTIGVLRRLNLWILGRASIQVNTVPSGHAAAATAVALAVGTALPHTWIVLLLVSASIIVATVAGRYHYVLDTVAGVMVGIGAWALVRGIQ